jgi:uncharacterized membrane protein (GlpM family)
VSSRGRRVKKASGSAGASSGSVGLNLRAVIEATPAEYGVRFAFGAAISVVAGLAGIRFGPRVGGLFLAFPAILPAALTLIEAHEGEGAADADSQGGILGGVGLLAFAIVLVLLVRQLGAPLALLAALLCWAIVAAGLYFLLRAVWPRAWR